MPANLIRGRADAIDGLVRLAGMLHAARCVFASQLTLPDENSSIFALLTLTVAEAELSESPHSDTATGRRLIEQRAGQLRRAQPGVRVLVREFTCGPAAVVERTTPYGRSGYGRPAAIRSRLHWAG